MYTHPRTKKVIFTHLKAKVNARDVAERLALLVLHGEAEQEVPVVVGQNLRERDRHEIRPGPSSKDRRRRK
jgi:hypothetical protein